MKKYLCLLLVLAAVFIFVGCQSAKPVRETISGGQLEDVLAAMRRHDDYLKV